MKEKPPKPDKELVEACQRNCDAIQDSAVFLCLFHRDMVKQVIPLLQIGLAVYLDKPIYILCPETRVLDIPINLRRMSRGMELFKDDDMEDMNGATKRLMATAMANGDLGEGD